jgi:NAD(P)-dependent dehydrogenase (short-subunit alcohol dehydrogenase family)
MSDLEGKVVVITGAGRPHGVGRETAMRFAEAGAKIVIADLDATDSTPQDTARQEIYGVLPDLHAVAEEIRRMGTEIEAISTDVSIESEVEHLVNTAVERFGTIDVMVTNAAIVADRQSDPLTLDVNIFNRVLAVNLTGAFLCARTAARAMVRRGQGGSIITVGSRSSRRGSPGFPAYSSSKFGVIGLTQSLALAFAPHGIRVNCVCPGEVDTDMGRRTYETLAAAEGIALDAAKGKAGAQVPLGRLTSPRDIANAIAWFASSESAHVTGQSLNVNGGTWLT